MVLASYGIHSKVLSILGFGFSIEPNQNSGLVRTLCFIIGNFLVFPGLVQTSKNSRTFFGIKQVIHLEFALLFQALVFLLQDTLQLNVAN